MTHRRRTIGSRVMTITMTLVIATSVTLGVVAVMGFKRTAYHELVDRGTSLSVMLARNSGAAIQAGERESLRSMIAALMSDENIAYVAIRDAKGKVIAERRKAGHVLERVEQHRGWSELRTPSVMTLPRESSAIFDVVTPIVLEPSAERPVSVLGEHHSNTRLGFVQAGLTSRTVNLRIRTFIIWTVVVTALILCVAIALSAMLTRRIVRPIAKLRDASLEIASGVFDHELSLNLHGEEITDTMMAFDLMRRRIGQMTRELEDRAEEALRTSETLRREVEERRQAEEALRSSEQRYALAAAGANDGLWDWDLVRQVLYLSPRWSTMLGYRQEDIGTSPAEWIDRIHPDDHPRVVTEIDAHLRGVTQHLESEHRLRAADGSYRWILARGLAVRDAAGIALRFAGSQSDVTSRRTYQERLAHDAFYDALTDLPNRTHFLERLNHAMVRSRRRHEADFAVIFIDLNRFKLVNDSFGHVIGDKLLVNVGRRIRNCVREVDTVARFGGDEFAILLEEMRRPEDVASIARKVCREIARSFEIDGYEIFSGASCGVAIGNSDYKTSNDLLRDADTAMYRAKFETREVVFFDDQMHADAIERLWMETELRRAQEQQQFYLAYQPIFETRSGAVAGVETLLRWEHPKRGDISPAGFIPITEETGLIVEIGESVLKMACEQWNRWRESGLLKGSTWFTVNLSARQFAQPSIVDMICSAVAFSGLPTDVVRLEVTESVFMDSTTATSALHRLRNNGFRLYLDDFGSGYSSLSYLHNLPLDVVKIDRSFITALSDDRHDDKIVRAIIDLAHHLHMAVIAEGVENEEQMKILQKLGCDYLQGFYLAKPMRAEELEARYWSKSRVVEFARTFEPALASTICPTTSGITST